MKTANITIKIALDETADINEIAGDIISALSYENIECEIVSIQEGK